jgi:hypothetical protein
MTYEPKYAVFLSRDQWLALAAVAENYVLVCKDLEVLACLAEIYAALDQNIPSEETCCRYPYPPGWRHAPPK